MTEPEHEFSANIIEAFYHPVLGLVVMDWDRETDVWVLANCQVDDEDEARYILDKLQDDDDETIGRIDW